MFAGVLTAAGARVSAEDAAALVSGMGRFPYARTRSLIEDSELSLFALDRDPGWSHHLEVKLEPGVTLWFCRLDQPVTADSELVETLARHDWNHVPSLPGLWLAAIWNRRDKSLRLVTDRLGGVWLYVARTDSGFAFSCDFASLAQLMGPRLHPDLDTALMELVVGYTPGERTLFEEIVLLQPGAVTELRGRDSRVISRADFCFGDRYVGSSRREKFAALDGIFHRITRDTLSRTDQILSLSAGYDSRYALGLMTRSGVSCPFATFGDPESAEVEGARAVAAIAGRRPDLFTFADADWESWSKCIRTLGNPGMVQWSGWAEQWLSFLRDRASGAIIGYLGDALSGKHLHPSGETSSWRSDWMSWSAGPWATSPFLSANAKRRFVTVAEQRFSELSKGSSYALPHQQALHLDLHGRQRRWVASQPNLMYRYVAPVTFFCDDELYDFWTNVSQDDLLKQSLYLEYARSRLSTHFPQTTAGGRLIERVASKSRRLLATVIGTSPRIRPPVVDRGRIARQNQEKILALLEEQAPFAEQLLDVGALRMAVESLDRTVPMDTQFSLMLLQLTNLLIARTSASRVYS